MTAIVRTRSFEAPPQARAGLVLPGLGHLLVLEPISGLGLLSLDLLIIWSLAGILNRGRIGEFVELTPAFIGIVLSGITLAGVAWLIRDKPRESYHWWFTGWWFAAVALVTGMMIGVVGRGWFDVLHPAVAVVSWTGLTAGTWHTAFRRAFPRVLTDEEYNSNRQLFLRTFGRNRTGMLGMYGVVFLIAATLVTPMMAAYDPNAISIGPNVASPSWAFLMGTDEYGRDVFSRVLYGGRISLSIGFIAAGIAATIGTTIGAIAAFFGGWVDRLLMYVVDMLLSLPRLVLLLAIVGMFRLNGVGAIFLIVVILGLTGWMGVSRIVRSQVLSLREQDFIQAARALGYGNSRIVFRHLIPNALAPVIVYVTLAIGSTMLAEAGLSFLGLGVQPPTSTWGTMVNDGREPLRLAPWIATFPGLAIVAAVMSFNLLGDGLRDALDPKMRGQ